MSDTSFSIQRIAAPRASFGRGARTAKPVFRTAAPSPAFLNPASASTASPDPASAATPSPSVAMDDPTDRLEIGRVLARAFTTICRNAVPFAALLAVAVLPERVILHLVGTDVKVQQAVSLIVVSLISLALQGAATKAALTGFAHERPRLGDSLATGFGAYFPLLGVGIIAALGIVAAALALVVPGIMLAIAWSVYTPVYIAEGPGLRASLGRSAALTKGHRWKILVLFLIMGLGMIALSAANKLFGGLPFAGLTRLSITLLSSVVTAALYLELCLVKDGGSPQQLAQVFD